MTTILSTQMVSIDWDQKSKEMLIKAKSNMVQRALFNHLNNCASSSFNKII